jgi:phospholipid/cholesterol/gamma-HCH transport system ATP-binding protein
VTPPVLALAAARLLVGGTVTAPLSLELAAGSLAVIDPQGTPATGELADACVGLAPPAAGQVLFQGRDWQAMTEAEACAARGRIGRCFVGGGFLPHLSVMENLTFAARHHAQFAEAAVNAQAAALARLFGLPGVPTGAPALLHRADLARASLVRAFLGRPALVVLEEPRRDLSAAVTPPLVRAIRRVRDRGGAVLWLTRGEALSDPAIPADARLRLAGGRLIRVRAEVVAA